MKWKYFLTWLPGIPIAILNGSVREFIFNNYMGALQAHQLSVLSFFFLFGVYVWFLIPYMKFSKISDSLNLGFFWLIYTIIFEFIFGHYVMGHSWAKLFYDYNLLGGRLWVLVLLWIFSSPWIVYHIKGTEKT